MTSSSGPSPAAMNARWSPAVAELTATACFAPTASPKCRSNSATRGPLVIQPDRRHATTASTSASPIDGRESGRTPAGAVRRPRERLGGPIQRRGGRLSRERRRAAARRVLHGHLPRLTGGPGASTSSVASDVRSGAGSTRLRFRAGQGALIPQKDG